MTLSPINAMESEDLASGMQNRRYTILKQLNVHVYDFCDFCSLIKYFESPYLLRQVGNIEFKSKCSSNYI